MQFTLLKSRDFVIYLLYCQWFSYASFPFAHLLSFVNSHMWFTITVYYVSIVRNAMKNNKPRSQSSCSDGGHVENLGIPLFKLRLKKFVSVDGSCTILDEDYGNSLLVALDIARKKLGCSFSGMDGRDIAEDIRDNFVDKPPGSAAKLQVS